MSDTEVPASRHRSGGRPAHVSRLPPTDAAGSPARSGPTAADADREAMARVAQANAELLVRVLRGEETVEGDPVMVALATARSLGVVVEEILRGLAVRARRDGHTWAEIGEVLHVTRQAALQRFGPAAGESETSGSVAHPIRGAGSRAVRMLRLFLQREWAQLRAEFDGRMTEACSAELLESVRNRTIELVGNLVEMRAPSILALGDHTVVDVPMLFERGQRTGRVTLDRAGRVAGFFLLVEPAAG